MLEAVLHPLDRAPCFARCETHRDDVGEDGLLDAEAAAGVSRAAQAEARTWNAQGSGHHRVQREGAREVGQNVVAVLAEVFGDDDQALDGGAGVAGIADGNYGPVFGVRERGVGIAVAEMAVAYNVRADFMVEKRGAGRGRRNRVYDRVKFTVLDFDPIEGIFRRIAIARHRDGDRLPCVPHSIDCERVVPNGLPDTGDEWFRPHGRVLAGQDRDDIGDRERGRCVESDDRCVRMG